MYSGGDNVKGLSEGTLKAIASLRPVTREEALIIIPLADYKIGGKSAEGLNSYLEADVAALAAASEAGAEPPAALSPAMQKEFGRLRAVSTEPMYLRRDEQRNEYLCFRDHCSLRAITSGKK